MRFPALKWRVPCRVVLPAGHSNSSVPVGIVERYVGDTITVGVEREEPRG